MCRSARASASLLCVALVAASVVHAQDTTEARLREALRDTAEKLHATEADLAQQQLATAAAERECDALKQVPHASRAEGAQTAALQRRLTEAAGNLAQAQADEQKLQAAQQVSALGLQQKETERAALAGHLSQLLAREDRCVANDDAFYGTGREIAALYRDPAFTAYFSYHRLPIGFDRVREENRVRALEDRFTDQLAQAHRCRTDTASAPPESRIQLAPQTSSPTPGPPDKGKQ